MAGKKILNHKIIQSVKHYAALLKAKGILFERIIVFGSQAAGKAKKWSDVDVCVVSKTFGKDRQEERVKLMISRDEISLEIEPHPFNPQDLQEKWDPLAHEIRQHGIPVL